MSSETPIRQRLLIFLSICYFVLPEISNAQSEWTESECIRYAIEHNLRIQNKKLDAKIANTDIIAAYGNFLPSISTISVLGKQFGHSIDPLTNQYTSESFLENTIGLNIFLPVFEGFSRVDKLLFYKMNKKINVLSSKVEENNLAFEVLEAFYRYSFDKEMHKLAVEQRRLSEYYCRQMMEYVDLGIRSLSDLQEVKARLQSDVYQETVKSNNCNLSLLTLKELMNIKETDTLSIVITESRMDITDSLLNLNELYSISELTLPEYHIMNMKEKASRKLWSMAKRVFYPSIRLEFNLNTGYYNTAKNKSGDIIPYREQLNNNMNRYIGICVSLPIFNGLSRLENIRKEELRLQQVQNENEQQRLSLYKQIHNTYLSFQSALKECQLAKEQLRADSITWKESEEKWREGMISMFELLEKRNQYMRSKAEIIRTKLQYSLQKRVIRFYQEGTFL